MVAEDRLGEGLAPALDFFINHDGDYAPVGLRSSQELQDDGSIIVRLELSSPTHAPLTGVIDYYYTRYTWAEDDPDRVVLFVSLKAEKGGRPVWHQTWAMDAWGDVRGTAMARLVSIPVALAVGGLLSGALVFGLAHMNNSADAPDWRYVFLAGLAVPTLALTVGWPWAFRVAAVIAIATAASVPRRELLHTLSSSRGPVGPSAGKPTTPLHLLVVLSTAVGLGIGALDPLGSFFVGYSVSIGVDEQVAGVLLAVGGFCGIVARLVAGRLIDQKAEADFTAIASMMVAGAAGMPNRSARCRCR